MWVKRSQVTYAGAHRRVYRARGSAADRQCRCGAPAYHWSYKGGASDEQIDPRGRAYSGDPEMYEPLCVPCHKAADLAAGGFTPAPCGTEKGYERHRRDRTPRCAPCKQAHAEAESVRRTARALTKVGG